jgi:sporulation protein YlmC with PRC-barrel domain
MLTRTLAATLLATACFCAPAMAQNSTTAPAGNAPAATQPMTGDTMNNGSGSGASSTSNSGAMNDQKFYTNTASGEWRASKFMGVDIYGPDNRKIGDVRELVMDHSGSVKAVVVGVGGFLGIGEKDVAIPFNQVQWTQRASTAANSANSNAANTTAMNNATSGAGGTASQNLAANNTAGAGANNSGMGATGGGNDTTGTVASDTNQAYPDRGVVTMTKQDLQNAPTYRYPDDRRGAGSNSTGNSNSAQ